MSSRSDDKMSGCGRRALGAVAVLCVCVLFVGSLLELQVHARALESRSAAPPPAVANPHGDIQVACEVCHTAENWNAMRSPSPFEHAKTGFALGGKHEGAACRACHASLVFAHIGTSCADCHRDVHEGRNGLRCQDCHVTERWVERSDAVRRHASTSFPLRGVHAVLECTRCHTGADEAHLTKVSSECIACHAAEYAGSLNPEHRAAGFSTRCEECHDAGSTAWSGRGFVHATTGFPLSGAHQALACAACHGSGQYAGAPTDCYACHAAAYEATQNPDHAAAGFGTSCAACHSTRAWQGARFDHDGQFFRIYSGKHAGKWSSCADCHTNPSRYGDFNCLTCHERARTDSKHGEVSGYIYESSACYSCHRRA